MPEAIARSRPPNRICEITQRRPSAIARPTLLRLQRKLCVICVPPHRQGETNRWRAYFLGGPLSAGPATMGRSASDHDHSDQEPGYKAAVPILATSMASTPCVPVTPEP